MDDRHAGHAHAEGAEETSSRRSFLRRAGITGALAAGLIGGAELAGMGPAYARSKQARDRNRGQRVTAPCTGCSYGCVYTPGKCGNCNGGCYFTCSGHCGTFRECNSCNDRPGYTLCFNPQRTQRPGLLGPLAPPRPSLPAEPGPPGLPPSRTSDLHGS